MCEKKIQVLKRLRYRYQIDKDGTVTNPRTGHVLKYLKVNKYEIVSMWDTVTKKNWQYSRQQLASVNYCRICNTKTDYTVYCKYCQSKINRIREEIFDVRCRLSKVQAQK
jgi:uncharacterized paraquat-inducible protein A